MPDLSGFVEALRRGFDAIPPVAIAIALLAGPTAGLVGYRLLSSSRRLQSADEQTVAPYWVCRDCRSVNELGHSRCYHCHQERDTQPELEVIVEAPVRAPGYFEAPAGSPFAALGQGASTSEASAGVPVMAHRPVGPVAVGPGRAANGSDASFGAGSDDADLAIERSIDELAPATQPQS
jgi:hypothetical protein